MNRAEPFSARPAKASPVNVFKLAHGTVFALFLITWSLLWLAAWVPFLAPAKAMELEGLLILLAAGTTLLSLSRQAPAQNVLLAAGIIALVGAFAHLIGARLGIPFGPFVYTRAAGPLLFHILPWAIPFIWVVAVLNSRGVARLILRPRLETPNYGLWVFGLTVALCVLFDFGLEPFATQGRHYWFWSPTKLGLTWYGAPVTNFLAWGVVTMLMLAFVTPPVINKRHARLPADFHPLIVWLLLNQLFVVGALEQQLWRAAGFAFLTNVVAAAFAVWGGARKG
jgi:uncharacterized membrane protein